MKMTFGALAFLLIFGALANCPALAIAPRQAVQNKIQIDKPVQQLLRRVIPQDQLVIPQDVQKVIPRVRIPQPGFPQQVIPQPGFPQGGGGPQGNTSKYPAHWPPLTGPMLRDYVQLPGGYGFGSSTEAAWIRQNMAIDAQRIPQQGGGNPQGRPSKYPAHWPPMTGPMLSDYVRLPGGYGFGSSTEAAWIRQNMAIDAQRMPQQGGGNPQGTASKYPAHWPPLTGAMTMDYVQLPGGYGYGSSTEAAWIRQNMAIDAQRMPQQGGGNSQHNASKYPVHWPPLTGPMTADYVQLPAGYGYGSSTEAAWIRRNIAIDAGGLPQQGGTQPRIPQQGGTPQQVNPTPTVFLQSNWNKVEPLVHRLTEYCERLLDLQHDYLEDQDHAEKHHAEKLDKEITTLKRMSEDLHAFVEQNDGSGPAVERLRHDASEFLQLSFRISRTIELTQPWLRGDKAFNGINQMRDTARNVTALAMEIDRYLPADGNLVEGQTELLEDAIKELHFEFHEHLENYAVSDDLDADLEDVESLVEHMHDLSDETVWERIDLRQLAQDLLDVKEKTAHIESLFVQQAEIGVLTKDWIGIEHARDAITDVLSTAYLLEHMIYKTQPQFQSLTPRSRDAIPRRRTEVDRNGSSTRGGRRDRDRERDHDHDHDHDDDK